MEGPGPMCKVCHKQKSKYRCPKCQMKYCCLQCFKDHKGSAEECVLRPDICDAQSANKHPNIGTVEDEIEADSEITEDTVQQDILALLGHNTKLLNMLHNPHLQKILLDVDSSRTSEKTIHRAMMEPIFTEFADVCLREVKPEKYKSET